MIGFRTLEPEPRSIGQGNVDTYYHFQELRLSQSACTTSVRDRDYPNILFLLAFIQAEKISITTNGCGIDGQNLLGGEAQHIMWSACLGSGA
jgi:hypothetical protein